MGGQIAKYFSIEGGTEAFLDGYLCVIPCFPSASIRTAPQLSIESEIFEVDEVAVFGAGQQRTSLHVGEGGKEGGIVRWKGRREGGMREEGRGEEGGGNEGGGERGGGRGE